ncbi:branched-chain amino acid transport system ATP-binding protein [Loktanella sp. DSM 29012]|uniref:ABC transporter ATP-binding protein n=1 Tax=Loktanella sp. DSM 29012 TaxID=1881056 RepID=UPI0008AE2188|nr:ABC transporter ATP-binding protein [Loktanella sp. DSM 29012]SEQ39132.1 branched-chain amino acid transport system ATP-binding protein [Loktanella sp. DSM 29012]
MLEMSNVTVRYGQHRALENAHITVGKGEIVVILGANGAGKSTLLKAASGICEGAVTGDIRLDGTALNGLSANRIVDAGLALVPEGRGVFPDLTVRENLTLGAYAPRARDDEKMTLDRVYSLFPKLAERGRQIVGTMSGGEQQMVAIGRAMMSNPNILTLDEPSLGLSPLLSKELFQNLARVRELGIGVLMVEQNAKQSLAIADRGYLIENAHVVHQDSAANLINDPAVQAAYLGVGSGDESAATPPATEVPETVAEAFALRPRSQKTISADSVLGRSVDDLVAAAGRQSVAATIQKRPDQKQAQRATVPTDRLAATLADIERSARAARNRPKPQPRPDRYAPSPPPAPPTEAKPRPVIEVYRAPRVEVYRRQPDGSGFERK